MPAEPMFLCLKKTILIIGTVVNFVIMTIITVTCAVALLGTSFSEKGKNSWFLILIFSILTLVALVAAAGELCGLLGTVKQRISLLKWHLAYGVLELVYQIVLFVCASYYSFSIPQSSIMSKGYDYGRHSASVPLWRSFVFVLFRMVLWYALVLWFIADLKNMQKHSVYHVYGLNQLNVLTNTSMVSIKHLII